MNIKAILFDLDGTLLPMNQENFSKIYFGSLAKKLSTRGYEPNKLIETIWAGTKAMAKNNGNLTNEKVFWKFFMSIYGEKSIADMPYFEEFYQTDFDNAKIACQPTEKAKQIIDFIKSKNIKIALATNPLFPAVATQKRIKWAGLSHDDFEIITTYENSKFCKPNPRYYQQIINSLGVAAQDCLMIGNDVEEDMVAATLGAHVFLLTDCLINKNNADISNIPNGNFDNLIDYLNQNI